MPSGVSNKENVNTRPIGIYWVWTNNKWCVSEWNGKYWQLCGTLARFADDDFERITAPVTEPWTGYEPKE